MSRCRPNVRSPAVSPPTTSPVGPSASGPRRRVVALASAAWLAAPALAAASAALPQMTDGPFYPTPSWRARSLDWDADLTLVRGHAPDGQPMPRAAGEHLDLYGAIVDADGRAVDGAEVEIWQCDVFGSYRHPRGDGGRIDAGFQGFGASRSDRAGAYRFRTIRPVPYTGRTPHIHVKLRHPTFGEATSQLFVAGDPGNERDFLWSRLSAEQRSAVEMRLRRATAGGGVAWQSERLLVVAA